MSVDGGSPATAVEAQVSPGQHHILLGELAQGQTADAGFQLCLAERLCKSVVAACVQPLYLILYLAAGGEDQHPCLPIGLT